MVAWSSKLRAMSDDDIVFLPPILNNIGILFSKQYSTSGVEAGTRSPPLANAKETPSSFKLLTTVSSLSFALITIETY